MACAKNATRRLLFVSLIVFYGTCNAIVHSTEVVKPSFFFQPLSYCGFQSLYQEKKPTETGFKVYLAPYVSANYSKNLIATGLGAADTPSSVVTPSKFQGNVDSDHIISVLVPNDNPLLQTIDETMDRPSATVTFTPDQKEIGLHVVIRHDLDFLIEGIFYSLEVDWIRQTRTLNPAYTNEFLSEVSGESIISLHDYFRGIPQSINDPLKALKLFDGSITQHGFSTVQATLGYHLFDKNDYRVTLLASAQLPCGPDHSLDYLFSPNIGDDHLQFGLGWHAFLKLADNRTTAWYLSSNVMGGYSFHANEARIPTIKNMPWAQYYQMMLDQTPTYSKSTPGTSMLPQSIKVQQGLSLQNTMILTYKHNDLRMDVGFSAGYREGEHNVLAKPWANNKTAVPNRYINPFNFTGASNNASNPVFNVSGDMYPSTTGKLPQSLTTQTFTGLDGSGNVITMTAATPHAWAQPMATKVVNNSDLEINLPTMFHYQLFASSSQKLSITSEIEGTFTMGGMVTFGEPSELMVRSYQLWVGLGCSF